MSEYCFACEEELPCSCTAPCPGCGALSGYTCRSDCPILAEYLTKRAREEDNDRNNDWDDGSDEPEPDDDGADE